MVKNNDLEHTTVYCHTYVGHDELLHIIKSDCLDELVLVNLHIPAKFLKQLLERHRQTIITIVSQTTCS